MVKVDETIQGKQYGNKLKCTKCTPLSANTVGISTEDIGEDLKKEVLNQVTQAWEFCYIAEWKYRSV